MAVLADSGKRRTFESGAVRDIQSGKGRCDLLPLEIIAEIYREEGNTDAHNVIICLSHYQETGATKHLFRSLHEFARSYLEESTQRLFLEAAKQFEDGAVKYGDRNWEKGIPVENFIDSGVRHFLRYLDGEIDEPHNRAFIWNILCCAWTCNKYPELNIYANKDTK